MLGLRAAVSNTSIYKWDPTKTVGGAEIQLWLKYNTQIEAGKWYDKSGNGRHITQTSSGDRAVVTDGGLDFEQTESDHYDLASAISIASEEAFHIFIVCKIESFTTQNTIFGIGGVAEFLEFQTDARTRMKMDGNTDVIDWGSGAFATGSKMLVHIKRDSGATGTVSLFKNGSQLEGTATSGDLNNPGAVEFNTLGSRGSDRFFDGIMYEILVYDTANLTTLEQSRITNYLLTKHDIG